MHTQLLWKLPDLASALTASSIGGSGVLGDRHQIGDGHQMDACLEGCHR